MHDIKSSTLPFKVEFHIDIEEEEMKYFDASRKEAKEKSLLQESGKQYKKASFTYQGMLYPVKLKLKGDMEDHWGGGSWSMRIKMPKGKSVLGLTSFSLQAPYTREYLNEWVFHKMLKEEGIMALDYRFVRVYLNGVDMECYAMEQHFADDIFATNKVDTTVVLRFNEDEWTPVMLASVGPERSQAIYNNAMVEAHNKKKVFGDPKRKAEFEAGKKLLEEWREGKILTTEAFDVQKMARFWAVSNILNAGHANCWNNRRFYYNAETKVLEPIGNDANPHDTVRHVFCNYPGLGLNCTSFFKDKEFTKAFLTELRRMVSKSYLDRFFESNEDTIKMMMPMLLIHLNTYQFDRELFYHNQKVLREKLPDWEKQFSIK